MKGSASCSWFRQCSRLDEGQLAQRRLAMRGSDRLSASDVTAVGRPSISGRLGIDERILPLTILPVFKTFLTVERVSVSTGDRDGRLAGFKVP
jgi:hypothetical protein